MKLLVIKITLATDADLTDDRLEEIGNKLEAMNLGERLKGATEFLLSDEPTLAKETASIVVTVED